METLEQTLETNRRLNRRLGSMENELYSLVSKAQSDTGAAQRVARDAQEAVRIWVKSWGYEVDRKISMRNTINRMGWAITILAVWGVFAPLAIWLSR